MSERAKRALGLLGLGMRARRLAVGVDAAHEALRRGRAVAIVLPRDAGERARERLVALAGHKRVPLLVADDAEGLGAALGRPPVHAVAVLDSQLARGLRAFLGDESREMVAG